MLKRIPKLRRHKPSQLAVVTLNGRDHYLGKWPNPLQDAPPEVRNAYDQLIAEWLANGRRLPSSGSADIEEATLSVNELILAFWNHAQQHYRTPEGEPTSEIKDYRLSLRPVRELYGRMPVEQFGPLTLKAVRQKMIEDRLCRAVVNQRIARIVRMFKWGVSEELVPETIWRALTTVRGLERGRTNARETEPVQHHHLLAESSPGATVEVLGQHFQSPAHAVVRLLESPIRKLLANVPGLALMARDPVGQLHTGEGLEPDDENDPQHRWLEASRWLIDHVDQVEWPPVVDEQGMFPLLARQMMTLRGLSDETDESAPRLIIDVDSATVTLDGQPFHQVDPHGIRVLEVLQSAGTIMTKVAIGKKVKGCKGEKAVHRAITALPTPLQHLIKRKTGSGCWLELPPLDG